jgi:hypothetical protein
MMNLSEYAELEKQNVFINYSVEHYGDGCNLNFSIEFRDYERAQTGWYNDNHEFGDVADTMEASVRMAKWYLGKPERIKMINSAYTPEYIKFHDELSLFITSLIKADHKSEEIRLWWNDLNIITRLYLTERYGEAIKNMETYRDVITFLYHKYQEEHDNSQRPAS